MEVEEVGLERRINGSRLGIYYKKVKRSRSKGGTKCFGCVDANGELRSASWERWVNGKIDSIKDDDNPTRRMDDVVFKYKRCCVI